MPTRSVHVLNASSLPSPPLLFIAIFTSHRSPLSERLEQANLKSVLMQNFGGQVRCIMGNVEVAYTQN